MLRSNMVVCFLTGASDDLSARVRVNNETPQTAESQERKFKNRRDSMTGNIVCFSITYTDLCG